MTYNHIKITTQQAEAILKSLFDIEGKAAALPGEIDFNFRIKVNNQNTYILKISRPEEDIAYLEYQQALLKFIEDKELLSPKIIKNLEGNIISQLTDDNGAIRYVRLLTWVEGRLWSNVNPQLDDLRYSLGNETGKLANALQGFDHPQAHRDFEWDVAQGLWTQEHLSLFTEERRRIISYFQQRFEMHMLRYSKLRKSVVHNDANDNNVVVSQDLVLPKVQSIIDFGDAIYTQIINDVAIACAYAVMHHNDPLQAALPIVKGYHDQFPLHEEELEHLYDAIAMRLVISVTKSALNKQKEPDNTYLLISEQPAWEVLEKWHTITPEFATYAFRDSCNFPAHPQQVAFENWAKTQRLSLTNLFPTTQKEAIFPLDLSVESRWIGHQSEFNNLDLFQFKITQLEQEHPNKIPAGGYLEPRPIYTSTEYDTIGNSGRESRSIHLGIDFWLPAQTPVHALFDGEIVTVINDAGDKEYGGLIILKHQENDIEFFTLHGHLSVASLEGKSIGDQIQKGTLVGYLGNYLENGNWAPHLHFQIMLSMLDYQIDFPGVAYPSQIDIWKSICPDPNLLFKIDALDNTSGISNLELINYRRTHLGKSLSLQYKVPIKMVRGAGVYLMDQLGNKYLDTVNNVAHVGHEHPAVVKAGQQQMALLNTNSRYLHENINEFAKELLETLPPELNVLHFVNSGSEANELAMRMVKAATGSIDVIASEVGYHGNSNRCIDISSYKFDGKGGSGAPEHTHIIPLPDTFRGKYTDDNATQNYVAEIQHQIDAIHAKNRKVGAFIIEPIISCGGQIELPDGFLAQAYEKVRKAGGVCISDEVQVGCGRVGKTFWGFQLYGVTPDIVTIGKPIGNGHPLAVVACTTTIAEKFANGMEYFNTFGGNPVSCAIGTEVLRTVKRERLQENADRTGSYLKSELQQLAIDFPIIGHIRGQGLFLGFELVDRHKNPLTNQASYLANRMKEHKILMSTDGKDNNVLKIKPPIVFSEAHAKELLFYLRKIFAEDMMQAY